MRFFDLLATAFLNLWRRKFRAFLTVLGMVIGVASIVVMVSLGIGIREATISSFASTGSLMTIQVNQYSYVDSGNGRGTMREVSLTQETLESFKRISGVTYVMPVITTYGMLKSGRYASHASIIGIDEESAKAFDFQLAEGRFPEGSRGRTYEMVMGSWTMEEFFNPDSYQMAVDSNGNPKVTLDSRMELTFDYSNIYPDYMTGISEDPNAPVQQKGSFYDIKPVGVMSSTGNNYTYYCLMEVSALQRLIKENKTFLGNMSTEGQYESILVKCETIDDVKPVKTAIEEMGYGTYSLQDAVEMAQESTQRVQYLLGAIGGVALLVAAIGIMNTMMMSIFERTKEIGILKVLGCRMLNIAGLFLAEAAFIGLFGGAMGLGLSYLISLLLNRVLVGVGMTSIIPAYLAIGAVAFSILVALLAGLYPAVRAMKLSPLAAIRNE